MPGLGVGTVVVLGPALVVGLGFVVVAGFIVVFVVVLGGAYFVVVVVPPVQEALQWSTSTSAHCSGSGHSNLLWSSAQVKLWNATEVKAHHIAYITYIVAVRGVD